MHRCPACDRELLLKYSRVPDFRFDQTPDDRFDVYECGECELLHTDISDTDLADFYPAEYNAHHAGTTDDRSILHRLYDRYFSKLEDELEPDVVRILQSHLSGGSVLDVGCGSGTLLHQLRQVGFEVHGCDVSENAVSTAQREYGLDVRFGELHELDYETDAFDAIVFNHSFEHLDKPHEYLSAVERILDEGIVVINVPNAASFEQLLFRHHWSDLDVPRHVYNWTPTALDRLMSGHGFVRVDITFSSFPQVLSDSLNRTLDERFDVRSPTPAVFDPAFLFVSLLGKYTGRSGRFCAVYRFDGEY